MIQALVFDTDAVQRAPGAPASSVEPLARMAGLTLLRRQILMAWRAGAEAAIVATSDAEAAIRYRQSEMGLPIPVTVIGPGDPLPRLNADDRVLVLAAQVYPNSRLLERLLDASRQSGRCVRAQAPRALVAGPSVFTGDTLRERAGAAADLGEAVRGTAQSTGCDTLVVDDKSYRWIDTPENLARTDRSLYHSMTSVADGYIDRVFNRHISRRFTRLIINLPITPNQVTALHFSMGLVAAWLFWQGAYWQQVLGAVLFQLSVALDCSDGEVARLKYQFSKLGSRLDVAADVGVTIAVFAAIARAAAVNLGPTLSLALGASAVLGVLMCVLVIIFMGRLLQRLQPGHASTLVVTNRLSDNDQARADKPSGLVEAVINEATSRDYSVIVVAFALAGKLEWFVWLAGVGSHPFWIAFAVIQWTLFRKSHAQSG